MRGHVLTRDYEREHDACGIFARIEKSATPTRRAIQDGVQALQAMRHRAGYVSGEGDGCGVMIDIPRDIWCSVLEQMGAEPNLVYEPGFCVAHLFLPRHGSAEEIRRTFADFSCDVLCTRSDAVNAAALGRSATESGARFMQVAAIAAEGDVARLYELARVLETAHGVHVASLDTKKAIYKVVGDDHTLWEFYDDLRDERCASSFIIAHTRYSTNTQTSIHRVQPFATLGHNGEINTIARFAAEAQLLGVPVDQTGSDSQIVSGVVHHFTAVRKWSLFETVELLCPPIVHEAEHLPADLRNMYNHFRALWGPFVQGPAGLMLHAGDEFVFSVDALGLRPLWMIETGEAFCFSSEQGLVPTAEWTTDPKPLAPGEKVGIRAEAGHGVEALDYHRLQRLVYKRAQCRYVFPDVHVSRAAAIPREISGVSHTFRDRKAALVKAVAFGWKEDDVKVLDAMVQTGTEPIKSLGFDSPLAALHDGVRGVPDFLHESVAVVTNPAIDREREVEHFSTRIILGTRPGFAVRDVHDGRIELPSPLLLEELPAQTDVTPDDIRAITGRHATVCFEDALAVLHAGPRATVELLIHRRADETIPHALGRLVRQAVSAVQEGAAVLVLDDRLSFARGRYVDPHLVLAFVHRALSETQGVAGEKLRRRTSIVLRSGSLRNLHDIMVALGFGADAVNPYLLWELAGLRGSVQGVDNTYTALCKGIEKVISTIGIHELRGYERLFGAIGLDETVAGWLGVPTFCGNQGAGFGIAAMERDATLRQEFYDRDDERALARSRVFQLYPRIWRHVTQVASGELSYEEYYQKLEELERTNPVSLRHLLAPKVDRERPPRQVESVDTSIDGHQFPFLISSMSFGSQNETAFRAYAEAAYRLNIVAMNGEGGEIKDLLSKYPRNRGRQIASGRFGVNAQLCNDAYILEIKIGQGAKPGEGGHLPGSKVSEAVAGARNATPGIDLISPSNNHDIYSIEDLAQVIHELRTVSPGTKIAVKVPVVPNIGTIAVGIVKAGADVVELSGFDGGTGAARAHAIRHVGLPADIGIKLVHEALCANGLRGHAEIWADGGMRSGMDALKAILLGANRVGFGTTAMMALGCTACRACHKDTCHVGIATQMNAHEAAERGVKQFVPQEFETATVQLVRWFAAVGRQLALLTAKLGAKRTQDLVGRSDLLEQVGRFDAVDLSWCTEAASAFAGLGTRIEYRAWNTEARVDLVDAVAVGAVSNGTTSARPWRTRGQSGDILTPQRVMGVFDSGERVRKRIFSDRTVESTHPTVLGNGLAAFGTAHSHYTVYGGAQDGVGKSAFGGRTVILKQRTPDGRFVGGSVGKGLAYGAQHGLFVVQGDADARAGIRLSGADIIVGGELKGLLRDELGGIAGNANLKGFAFEYMTAGRALVLGDPGPWMCSGMTGGSVYVRIDPSRGLTESALRRRLASGAKVLLRVLDEQGLLDVLSLLAVYHRELRRSGQAQAAAKLLPLMAYPRDHFRMIRPGKDVTDQSIATE